MRRADRPVPTPLSLVRSGVERRRVAGWLAEAGDVPVRILCGPIGAGKTHAVRQFVSASRGGAVYVRVPGGATGDVLMAALEQVAPGVVIVFDGIDRAEPEGYAAFIERITFGEIDRKLVLVGRSRRALRAETLLARGVARVCDQAALVFTADEIEALAVAHGVAFEDHDVAQLLHDTDGWPVAVAWLVRDAAENGRTLRDAFSCWRERNGHLLFEFVEREGTDPATFAEFRRALPDGWPDAQQEAERLEQHGLPISRTRTGLRPYRILARLAAPAETAGVPAIEPSAANVPPLMTLFAFGRFRCEVGGTAVTFSRRRDQQVFTYVALAPERRVMRDHLIAAFWPGLNHTVAAQGLRTTLCRIRRAIADAVPGVDPKRYFRTAGEVCIDPRAVAVDAHRFVDHVEQGRLDEARGALEGAKQHYRAARRVYSDRLLASEDPGPCLERRADEFEALYIEVLTRITELHAAAGDFEVAREAARTLIAYNTEETRGRALRGIAVDPSAETA